MSFEAGGGLGWAMDAARQSTAKILGRELGRLGVHVSVVNTGPLLHRSRTLLEFSFPGSEGRDTQVDESLWSDERSKETYDIQTRRARLFSRISTLWAVDDAGCFWIVRRAVEAQYPKRTYSFGLDVLLGKWTCMVPDAVWQLASWVAYERLGVDGWLEAMLSLSWGSHWAERRLARFAGRVRGDGERMKAV